MSLAFDLGHVAVTEFGVGLDSDGDESFFLIPVDDDVQAALREMAASTWEAMEGFPEGGHIYEPAEKHAGTEYLYLPLRDHLSKLMRELHEANNVPMDVAALSDTDEMFCYFARFTDDAGRRLTALRRATQFKGVLKSRLIRFRTDAMKLVEDRVFKLDNDFDLLIDSKLVHILRPSGFEFAAKLQEAILAAVPENIRAISGQLKFVDLSGIEGYAREHPRAARYLASINSQGEARNLDPGLLRKRCTENGVVVRTTKGKMSVADEHVIGFLEVLDRRRYELTLVKGLPERFKASSRNRLGQ